MKTLKCYKGMEAADNTAKTGDIIKNNDSVNTKKLLVHSGDAKDIESKTNEPEHDIVVDSYYKMTHDPELKKIPGQANHTNQNAVYKQIVPTSRASCVKLEGDVFKEPGSQHYKFHSSLENWWDQYRDGGDKYPDLPTDYEYENAVEQAYIDSGVKPIDARYAVQRASEQLAEWRVLRYQETILGRKYSLKEQKKALSAIRQTFEEPSENTVDDILKEYKVPRIPEKMNLPKEELEYGIE